VIDAEDKFVMPGGIDMSTSLHFNLDDDDNFPLADDFSAGTRAALAGGTTMIVDNVVPKKGQSLVHNHACM
jgi:dihydropyrimidinase